jgi:hypothetical protein
MMVANLNTKERLKNQVDSFPQKKKMLIRIQIWGPFCLSSGTEHFSYRFPL